jgi:hypothetical protein
VYCPIAMLCDRLSGISVDPCKVMSSIRFS